MKTVASVYGFQCSCGANRFSLKGEPAMRAVCHCLNCQAYNQRAYGDFLVYRESQVVELHDAATEYKAFKNPPMVMRGTCTRCNKPVAEKVNIPLFPKLFFVPVVNHPDIAALPAPALQMFSHRQIEAVPGDVPSYSGYLGSEVPFVLKMMRALYRQTV